MFILAKTVQGHAISEYIYKLPVCLVSQLLTQVTLPHKPQGQYIFLGKGIVAIHKRGDFIQPHTIKDIIEHQQGCFQANASGVIRRIGQTNLKLNFDPMAMSTGRLDKLIRLTLKKQIVTRIV
ncbi:MAG: hypothetical protein H6938_07850 [Burkholderiales bacterium]|nr:hypothetical protein [Burkholderiales bacterium]